MSYSIGIDIGSTTAKLVILDKNKQISFSAYRRHNIEVVVVLHDIIQEARNILGDIEAPMLITGSAGMGIGERFGIPFIQEVIASARVVRQLYPEVRTFVDIGGEDAKVIFFDAEGTPDIRMNGACAGRTGAFIDQMATLLNIPVSSLKALAEQHTTLYPIASRCGVFAKTDVQNLLSRKISHEDIVASIFNAVALQTLTTLARGQQATPKVLFGGGPLTFLPALRDAVLKALQLDRNDLLDVPNTELLPAIGAALAAIGEQETVMLTALIAQLDTSPVLHSIHKNRLPSLFENDEAFQEWDAAHAQHTTARINIDQIANASCFLGVDSGSTTTKMVLIDSQGRIFFDFYCNNNGDPIGAVKQGFRQIRQRFAEAAHTPRIARSMVTGYGEDLIRAAFNFDAGMVETLAHYRAARAFDPDVSFILDIGGQDMKAIFVQDGHIRSIAINEACSSGCGSFIETFARSLGYSVSDFAREACRSSAPCDLGTRCTVFMNSKVKQALREGASVGDISAGLAYSVIKNALHKVLKVTEMAVLGEHIVVQGGAFCNPAIHRAMEHLVGRSVLRPDISALMGAYGAALTARDTYQGETKSYRLIDQVNYTNKLLRCKGCENVCNVTRLKFDNGNVFYTGNRCERIFTNRGEAHPKGVNLLAEKRRLLFERKTAPDSKPLFTIGIPRALNLYEHFPFWNALFVGCGIRVQLSDPSSSALYDEGVGTVMAENICFPAKLVHGHILNLLEYGVDRIFYPMVLYERAEFDDAMNSYNCPVVAGYPDVIRSAINLNFPFDAPEITFNNARLLRWGCYRYLRQFGISRWTFRRAFDKAIEAQRIYRENLRARAAEVLGKAAAERRRVVLLAGRPYHLDPLIDHKIPEILAGFGVDVMGADTVPQNNILDTPHVLSQWAYPNRLYHAARWAREQRSVEVVQLNSFGCGPDAITVDATQHLLEEYGRLHTLVRIDEMSSAGSIKLRLRSMIEATHHSQPKPVRTPPKVNRIYRRSDHDRLILAMPLSHFYDTPFIRPLRDFGYPIEMLPNATRESVEVGLKYANNDICYPATIVIGNMIKALQSGAYDPDRVALGLPQTGGACRASSYVMMLKRGLMAAGFEQIPVVSLSTRVQTLNQQPGFTFDIKQYTFKLVMSLTYCDVISTLYHATAIRERHKGQALTLANHYLALLADDTFPLARKTILDTLAQAVKAFNDIATNDRHYPRVGLVGEIYVKHNEFANYNAVRWLMDQGLEVVIPPVLEFFTAWSVSANANIRLGLKWPSSYWLLLQVAQGYMAYFSRQAEHILRNFRHYRPRLSIHAIARNAKEILSLANQYGEGWLIAGEVGSFVHAGIQNILCLQPFGCISNHVVAKGVERRLKSRYPDLNLLILDTDAGISEVNFFNRMHFFADRAAKR